jgi:hypothetical protein
MRPGMYDHLDQTDPPTITLSMEELARKIEGMNYGTHRFLSALIRARKERYPNDPGLWKPLEDMLNAGFF